MFSIEIDTFREFILPLSRRERVARASGPGEGYLIFLYPSPFRIGR
jgi:hypothetical protein